MSMEVGGQERSEALGPSNRKSATSRSTRRTFDEVEEEEKEGEKKAGGGGGGWTSLPHLNADNKAHRWFIFCFSTLVILFTSGSIYGWAPLALVLKENHVYYELCVESIGGGEGGGGGGGVRREYVELVSSNEVQTCEAQELALNFVYTMGLLSGSLCVLAWGLFLDYIGSRPQLIITGILFATGCLLFAFSYLQWFNAYIVGWMLLAIGASGMFYGLMPLADLFGSARVKVLTIFSCSFDASTLLFPAYNVIYKLVGLEVDTFFFFYAIIPIPLFCFVLVWPTASSSPASVITTDESTPLLDPTKSEKNIVHLADQKMSEEGGISTKSFRYQFFSWDYLAFFCWSCMHTLWMNMYIGSVAEQLQLTFNPPQDQLELYVMIFSWTMPATVILSPVIGWATDRAGRIGAVWIAQFFAISFILAKMVPILPVQIVTFAALALWRPCFYAAALAYLIEVYSFRTFGRLWGLTFVLQGLVGYLQYPILEICFNLGNFHLINVVQLVCLAATSIFPICLIYRLPILLHGKPKIQHNNTHNDQV